MKLEQFKIKNFRGYNTEIVIDFDQLTAFVGRNDIGKSTILEALDIFFNAGKGIVKIDATDVNKSCLATEDNETVLTACFSDLPNSITIDTTYTTTLEEEHLLNEKGQLEIVKKYKSGGTEKVFIKAFHPTNPECSDLLSKKNADLKKIIGNAIPCENKSINSVMRKAIWQHFELDLQLAEVEIDVSKGDTDGIKTIWEKLQNYLPIYSLFQSDRKNSDSDDEVQDPLQTAVKQIISTPDIQDKLKEISDVVLRELQTIAADTLNKLNNINPHLASTLVPKIPGVESLKWTDVFKKVSISSNEDIPINKRGSGVKRLILLSFFQAEAEKKKNENNNRGIIYAIEEPETSQHFEHQKILIAALKRLSENANTQIVITTHSSLIVKNLDFSDIKIIDGDSNTKEIKRVTRKYLPAPSLNEVNYLTFGEVTYEYHDELYGYLQTKAIDEDQSNSSQYLLDNWLVAHGCTKEKNWIKIKKDGSQVSCNYTLATYIRNRIHHPENTLNQIETIDELRHSIELLQRVINSIS